MGKFNEHETVAKEYNLGGGSEYFNIKEGENRIKILSEYVAYGSHFIKADKRSYACIGKEKGCVHCANGDAPKPQFMMWVLNRETEKVELAQLGYSVIKPIGDLSNSTDWGFDGLPPYDLIISRKGTGLDTRYTITPTRKETPLTPEEEAMFAEESTPIEEIIQKMKDKVIMEGGVVEIETAKPTEEIRVENIPF